MLILANWELFLIGDLFHVKKGKRLTKAKMINGTTPYLGAIDSNNGVSGYIGQSPIFSGGAISVNYDGSIGECFYQPDPFWASDAVNVLVPKFEMSVDIALFVIALLRAEKYRFNYGRKWHSSRMEDTAIKLPSKLGNPDWEFIHKYMEKIPVNSNMYNGANSPAITTPTPELKTDKWKSFSYSSLFTVKKGKRLTKSQMTFGETPYIGAVDSNNGVSSMIGQSPIHKKNTISLSYNGSVGEAFYQPLDFWATDDVNVLYPRFAITPEVSLFICALMRKEKYRFNYGRKWTMGKMNKSIIKLPVKDDDSPDFNFMENYIKSLPYSSQL